MGSNPTLSAINHVTGPICHAKSEAIVYISATIIFFIVLIFIGWIIVHYNSPPHRVYNHALKRYVRWDDPEAQRREEWEK